MSKELKYETRKDKKARPFKGGGKEYVEHRVSRSIESMLARMLATGELQQAMHIKSSNIGAGSKERAVALMKSATSAPNYMRDGDIYEMSKKMKILDSTIKKSKKEKEDDEIINEIAEKRAQEIRDKTV